MVAEELPNIYCGAKWRQKSSSTFIVELNGDRKAPQYLLWS